MKEYQILEEGKEVKREREEIERRSLNDRKRLRVKESPL